MLARGKLMHSRLPAVYVSETHHPSPTYSKHLQLNAPCSPLVPKHHVARKLISKTFTCTCNCCNAAHIAEKISASTMYQQFLFSAIYLRHSLPPPLHKLFIFASHYSIETFGTNWGPDRECTRARGRGVECNFRFPRCAHRSLLRFLYTGKVQPIR